MGKTKFRGRDIETGKWIFGDLIWGHYIYPISKGEPVEMLTYLHVEALEIDPETVGQYSGRKDKNGEEIYNGDICQADHDFGPGGFHERFFEVRFCTERGYQWNYWDMKTIEIMGNKFENPELLTPGG